MPYQTASRITNELAKNFDTLGFPKIVNSDQGQNFESSILRQSLDPSTLAPIHTSFDQSLPKFRTLLNTM